MTVETGGETIAMRGDCGAADAEPLLRAILDRPEAAIDWSSCSALHAAVLQVLLASRATVTGAPAPHFLRDVLAPSLRRNLNPVD